MAADTANLDDHGGWAGVLGTLADGNDLTADAAEAALATVLAGEATEAQLAGMVVALRIKGESIDEMTGLVRAMRGAAMPLEVPEGTIDLVGAGGSAMGRKAALNVSTMASFVAAGAGAKVCKHGNRKASSTSGSFDLLEELGIAFELDGAQVAACLDRVGVAFAFARLFHPAMRFAGPVRGQLGIPTVFNVLGPLSHPGGLTHQVVGVPDPEMGERMIQVLKATGSVNVMMVTGHGGLDEFSTTGPNTVWHLKDGEIATRTVDPASLGLTVVEPEAIHGGDAKANAAIAKRLFDGEAGPVRDIVCLNAAAGLVVAGLADDMVAGLNMAYGSIDSGAAGERLVELIAVSNKIAPNTAAGG